MGTISNSIYCLTRSDYLTLLSGGLVWFGLDWWIWRNGLMDWSVCTVQGWFGISWPKGVSNVEQLTNGKDMAGLWLAPPGKTTW